MNNINAIKFCSEGTSTISLAKIGEPPGVLLEYSYNGTDWSTWDLRTLTINSGDILCIRGNNPSGLSHSNEDTENTEAYYSFIIEGDNVSCSGNIMSLIDYKNLPDVIPCSYCFYGLFENCNALTTAPELPAQTLTDWCYAYMFDGCTSLKTAPELPSKTLTDWCYAYMFFGCSSLTTAPELPAIELTDSCYYRMFSRCSSLTTAPELPAMKLADWCYGWMFESCSSLKAAPELPAARLANFCYSNMFSGCTALNDEQYFN